MNRRLFFSSFAKSSAAVAATTALAVQAPAGPLPDKFERDGWRYMWSGWSRNPGCFEETGFWVAASVVKRKEIRHPEIWMWLYRNHAHSCIGGSVGWLGRGEQIDTIHHYSETSESGYVQDFINMTSSDEERQGAKHAALARLIKFLDEAKATA